MKQITTLAGLLLLAGPVVCAAEPDSLDFQSDVVPILRDACVRCHNPGNAKGDLSLATAADVLENQYVVPGDPDASYLLDIVQPPADGGRPEMPKDGEPLTGEQIATLRQWIAAGAKWPEGVKVEERAAADATWWSLQPLAAAEPPVATGAPAAWQQNPIDRFVFAGLQAEQLQPSPPADKRTLIRRATYDLTGLPPTPDDVAAFLADGSDEAYERLIDRLLASPHYGERWGRHWLDVVRFGESRGFERNQIIDNAWPFRDYVIQSFNDDKPFDRFIQEHLAGDVLGSGDPSVEVGTTFLIAGPYDDVGNQDAAQAAQIRANTIDDTIRAVGEAFLGLTVGCARCHNHKFDPIVQRDYYSLYATFAGVYHGDRVMATAEQQTARNDRLRPLEEAKSQAAKDKAVIERDIQDRANQKAEQYAAAWTRPPIDRKLTEEFFEPVKARYVRLSVDGAENNPAARSGFRIDEFEVWTAGPSPRNVALAANGGRAEGASRSAEDFAEAYSAALTIDGQFGAHWFASAPDLTITLPEPATIHHVVFSSDRTGAAGDHGVATFVSEYRIEVSVDGQQWTRVADSYDRRPISEAHRRHRLRNLEITADEESRIAELDREIGRLTREIAAVSPLPAWWVGDFRPVEKEYFVFVGGNPQRPGDPVTPASLSTLDQVAAPYRLDNDSSESERRLALARWIVSPDNPLTPRVLANRLWHYHFGTGIVDTPSDFGYMGSQPTHPELLDWLAGQIHQHGWQLKPIHKQIMLSQTYRQASDYRAEAAAVDADSRLLWRFPPRRLSAEELRDTMLAVAGKLDPGMGGPGFRLYHYIQDNVATYIPLDEHGPETYRRAVYHQNARSAFVDLMAEFDCPDNAFAAPRRAATTTPLQALTLMNHSFTIDMAGYLAERLEAEAGGNPRNQIQRAFALAFARPPDDAETASSQALIKNHGLRAFSRAILNSTELIYVE